HRHGDGADPSAGGPEYLRHQEYRAGYPLARRGMGGDAVCRADDVRRRRAVHLPGDRNLVCGRDHGPEIIASSSACRRSERATAPHWRLEAGSSRMASRCHYHVSVRTLAAKTKFSRWPGELMCTPGTTSSSSKPNSERHGWQISTMAPPRIKSAMISRGTCGIEAFFSCSPVRSASRTASRLRNTATW